MSGTRAAAGDAGPLAIDEVYPAREAGIGVRFLEVRDGLRLRVLESGPPGGPPVVLFHGWGASVYSYRDAIPALAAAGRRVVAVDLPGHGLSDKPPDLEWYTRPAMTATAGALLEALDVRGATVVGVSMGGGIAAGLAVAGHARVRRVALVNPVGFSPVRFTSVAQLLAPLAMRDYAAHLVARPLVGWFLRLAYWDASRVTERDVDEYWSLAARPGYAPSLVACLHQFSWAPFAPDELARVAVPVLLIVGTHDHLISGSEARARAIPRLQVLAVEGGHAVNEERPDAVNAALLEFARE
ncbi:MAG: alpha/beta fold hydrolase [Gemmatimonadota bacterium]|nr:alpha/beta fold hydrolase [Gemmatimonadota bacterium]